MQHGEHKDLMVWQFDTLQDWINWLVKYWDKTPTGIWVRIAKKNTGVTTTTYEEVREGALCYGWIDGLVNKFDEIYYLIKLTPRRPKSVWSKINVGLSEQYITEGKMQPSGLTQIESAKADGRWDKAY